MAWGSHGHPRYAGQDTTILTADEKNKKFVDSLRQEGWTDVDFEMFVSAQCAQLRSFVLNNIKSRR